jgi:HipA-like protein
MKRLVVYLNGVRVGLLSDADEPVFAYDPDWLATDSGYPLSRQLPLQAEPVSGRGVAHVFLRSPSRGGTA